MGWALWILLICAVSIACYSNPEKAKSFFETVYSEMVNFFKKTNRHSDEVVPYTSTDWHNSSWKRK